LIERSDTEAPQPAPQCGAVPSEHRLIERSETEAPQGASEELRLVDGGLPRGLQDLVERPEVQLPDPNALGMQGSLKLASPVVGFTFRADTDLVPPRFTIDAVESALSSTKRIR